MRIVIMILQIYKFEWLTLNLLNLKLDIWKYEH